MRHFSFILLVFTTSASAQIVQYVRPETDISRFLTIRQERNLERTLDEIFPIRALHHATHDAGKIMEERITYDVIKQHGTKYAIVIFCGSWKREASRLEI